MQGLLAGRSILVVEDDYLIAMDVDNALRQAGAQVLGPVPGVAEAMALVRTVNLDAAVLDVALGRETAHELAKELRARRTPFVLATGNVNVAGQPDFEGAPVLEKPVRSQDLVRAIAGIMS